MCFGDLRLDGPTHRETCSAGHIACSERPSLFSLWHPRIFHDEQEDETCGLHIALMVNDASVLQEYPFRSGRLGSAGASANEVEGHALSDQFVDRQKDSGRDKTRKQQIS